MNRPLLAAALGVAAGLILGVPALILREFGWFAHGGRELEPASESATLHVKVLDARTDTPVDSAWVWFDGEMNHGAASALDGTATLEAGVGTRLLVVDSDGMALEGRVVKLSAGENEQVLRLRPELKLRGRVELPDGGAAAGAQLDVRPLEWPGMTVSIRSADADGTFAVRRLGLEAVRLEAWVEGVGRAARLVRAPDEEVVLRLSPEDPPGLPGETEPDDPAAGSPREGESITVLNPDGGPAAGAWVLEVGELPDGGTPGLLRRRAQLRVACTTGAKGTCLAPADGGCLLASAWPHADSEVTCGPGRTRVQLRDGAWLSGSVRGLSSVGGWVETEDGAFAVVDADGGFRLGPLPRGTHPVRAFDARGESATDQLQLSSPSAR